MANDKLTAARLREVIHYDQLTGICTMLVSTAYRVPVGRVVTPPANGDYMRVQIDGVRYKVHRLAWLYCHGSWPTHTVDHINGDKTDNRLSNLRDVPHQTNVQNKRRAFASNKSGFLGVSLHGSGKWAAALRNNGKTVHVGLFETAEEAHSAYLKRKRELHSGCTI
jgi:hypothetical protein